MKLQYLGTGAAEGIPGLFCQCPVCRDAAAQGGKNIRGRCGVLLDGTLLIDFPPDIFMQVLRFGLNLAQVSALLVSHAHHDHFDAGELVMRKTFRFCTVEDGPYCLPVYGNDCVRERLEEALEREMEGKVKLDFFAFHRLEPFAPVTAGEFSVTPLPAMHHYSEQAFNFLIEKDGKSFLYGHDAGGFYDSVFDYLRERGICLDAVSLDCTLGKGAELGTHMGIPADSRVLKRLRTQHSIDEHTHILLSHIGHNCGLNYAQLETLAIAQGMQAAYDGLILNL